MTKNEIIAKMRDMAKYPTVTLPRDSEALKNAANLLKQQKQSEPVHHSVIAGVLFDFMGWLTSREKRIVLSSTEDASPAADAIREFAQMRSLSLDGARVQDWNTTTQQRTWVGLTDEEYEWCGDENFPMIRVAEMLKEKNHD